MPTPASPAVLVVYQNALPAFTERLNGLLRALFPEASLDCLDSAEIEARLATVASAPPIFVLVGRDRKWLEGLLETTKSSAPLALLVPRPETKRELEGTSCFRADDPEQLEEFVGHVAQRMQLPRAVELGAHRSKVSELSRIAAELGRSASQARLRRLAPIAVGVGTLLAMIAGWKIWQLTREPAVSERFGFESTTNPWQCQAAAGTRGCVSLRHATQMSKSGANSLEMVVDLDPNDPDRRSAEIWAPAEGVDLDGRRVVAWVRPTQQLSGARGNRTGFQIYVKDAKWRSCYGAWVDASPNEWQRLQLKVGSADAGQFVEPGFDGREIAAIGVKLALPATPSGRASGSAHVDAVGW